MRRRRLLAAGTLLLSGCLGADAPRPESVDEYRTRFGVNDEHTHGEIDLELVALWVYPDIRYEDFDDASFGTWDPGPETAVVLASWHTTNRSDDAVSYPAWDQFVLITPEGRTDPIQTFSNGIAVEGLRDQTPTGVDLDGLSPAEARDFMTVFEAAMDVPSTYAIEWTHPDEPIVFGPD